MNHTSTRFLSLVLAVTFLLSAAGMSLGALFRGVEAHAEEVDSGVIEARFYLESGDTVSRYPVGTRSERYLLDDGKTYQVEIDILDTRFNVAPAEKLKAKFIGSDAFSISGSENGSIGKPVPVSGVDGAGIRYTVTFKHVKYNNKRNQDMFSFSVGNSDITAETFNVYVIDSYESYRYPSYGGNDDDDESSSSKADIEPPTPTIIVSRYDYGSGVVTAASDFTLRIRFTNTSKKLPVDNIVMKVTMPDAFTMTNSSNTFYVEKLGKESSLERELSITVKPSAEPISQVIKIAFTYEAVIDEKRKQLTAEQEISIPVSQLDRFSFTPIEAPPEIYVGDSSSIEAKFVNKGKSTVFNVTAEIAGNITQPGQRQFIGNIESGKEETADFLIEAKEAGEVQGEVVITYEDANMHVTTLRQPFNAVARAMEIQPPSEETMGEGTGEPPKPEIWYGKIPISTWVAGGAGLLIVVTFISKLVRHYREKKLLEDDDEDF